MSDSKVWPAVSGIAAAVSALVAVLAYMATQGGSTSAPAQSGAAPGAVPQTSPTSHGPTSKASKYTVSWSGEVRIPLRGLDLGATPPKVDDGHRDLYVDINPQTDVYGDSGTAVAEWTGDASPTADQCSALIAQNAAVAPASVPAKTGDRVCVLTADGRLASLRVEKQTVAATDGLTGSMTIWSRS